MRVGAPHEAAGAQRYNSLCMASVAKLPEIDLAVGALVIADLHLDVGPRGVPHLAFERFVAQLEGVPQLVVLGDLFDAWVGPAQMELPAARRVVELLRGLFERGTRVDVLVGNRDFLLEERFERATRATVHPHGFVGRVGETRLLFVHGDELCTLDHGYQRLKRVLRSRSMLWAVPRLPRAVSLAAARRLRRASVTAVAAKPEASKEQQADQAVALARGAGVETLICGHAHRFRDEPHGGVRWIVLDAFGVGRDVLKVKAGGALENGSSADA